MSASEFAQVLALVPASGAWDASLPLHQAHRVTILDATKAARQHVQRSRSCRASGHLLYHLLLKGGP